MTEQEKVEMTEKVIARMEGIPACPDCGEPLLSVFIEEYENTAFKVDWEKKTLTRMTDTEKDGEQVFRCGKCGSLNVESSGSCDPVQRFEQDWNMPTKIIEEMLTGTLDEDEKEAKK
jgi:hypothetical protein